MLWTAITSRVNVKFNSRLWVKEGNKRDKKSLSLPASIHLQIQLVQPLHASSMLRELGSKLLAEGLPPFIKTKTD
jgi:hypothetical protein